LSLTFKRFKQTRRLLSPGLLRRVVEVHQRFRGLVALMMAAASTSEMSVNFYQTTRRNNPEDSNLHIRRRENMKFHVSSKCSYAFFPVPHVY
jgi:hypothetical protein